MKAPVSLSCGVLEIGTGRSVETHRDEVVAELFGDVFAVHHALPQDVPNRSRRRYVITHVPTGRRLDPFLSAGDARRLAARLANRPLWSNLRSIPENKTRRFRLAARLRKDLAEVMADMGIRA